MILRELTLQNFRSYGETPTKIELDRGLLLFEGDIGSGKSSILYAIEFALFGLGELEARSVLRSSANTVKVELEFAVGEQEYKITRTVERKKGVKTSSIQTRGWLQDPTGKVSELSATELRSRVLQILNFKERQSARASSRIYRYAVFTPQELMKEVLAQRSEDRLDTLRRAFGVEDYSFAASNTDILLSYLEKQVQIYSKLCETLPQKETLLQSKRIELSSDEANLDSKQRNLLGIKKELEEAKSLFNELDLEVRRIGQLQMLVPTLEGNLAQVRTQLLEEKSDLQRNARILAEIQSAERQLDNLKERYEKYLTLREKLREYDNLATDMRILEDQISKLKELIISKEASLNAELEFKREQSKKICEAIETYHSQILSAKSLEDNARKLRENVETLSILQNKIEELKSEIGNTIGLLSSRKSRINEAETKIEDLDGISRKSKCPLCGQALNAEHLRNVDIEYRTLIKDLRAEESTFQAKLSELNSELNVLEKKRIEGHRAKKELETLEEKIARIHEIEKLVDSSNKELYKLEESSERISTILVNREFAKESEQALSEALAKRELLSESLKEYEQLRENYQKLEDSGIAETYQNAQSIVKNKSVVQDQINLLQIRCQELEKQMSQSMLDLEQKKKQLEQSEPIIFQHAKIKEEVKRLEDEHSGLNLGVQILLEKVKRAREEQVNLSREVEELRKNAARVSKSQGIAVWLSENFVPAIGDVERYVLASINEEFSQVFQRIFSMLVVEDGDLTAKIDDRFTPIIEQAGYELDVQSLSGGERTALALAYRLALNYMVKRANEALQTNLLIMDEPTEGFSKEQIYRFRNALEELANDQVIIVSHERDLEPMADRVFRIEKANGESLVTLVAP
ncbi:MAG: SMC family ATPase [archaeon]|nr:SMC family ATPase [archaeon]